MQIKKSILTGVISVFATTAFPCTNLLVGKNASTDGSTFITYAADSHVLYGELYYHPAGKHAKGSIIEIHEWDTGKFLGKIPQIEKTYQTVGNTNEHQLSIAETTFGGRPELQDTTGVMDYGSLIYLTLQRAKNAREAIQVMTDLVEKHGYYSHGESFSIADPKEIWVMDMIGKGGKSKGAVWVAVRIPDDCISAHANQARIRQFPLNDPANCIYSKEVISFARTQGYFNGKDEEFSFVDAYAPADFSALRGCEARVWSFFRKHSDDMDRYLPYLNGESKEAMPLYIKPKQKLSLNDMREGMRDHYEGTPFDMQCDVGAGPYKVPYRWRPMNFTIDGESYVNERAIATQQTGFVFISQMRSWLPDPVGGILWFGTDDANTTVFVPMYNCIQQVPECFRVGNGDLLTFSWTSAFWIYNWVANMAYNKYSFMIEDVRKVQTTLESGFEKEQPIVEQKAVELYKKSPKKAIQYLSDYSNRQAVSSTESWKKLGEYLLVKYIDGNVKKEKNGQFERSSTGMPVMPNFPGYSEEYYRSVVKDAGDRLKVKNIK